MVLRFATLALLISIPLVGISAQATPPAKPKPKPAPVKFTADLGYVSTSGNTSVQTLNVGDKVVAKFRTVSFTQQFAVVHGKSKGETVASNWRSSLRTDVSIRPNFGVFGSLNYERNVFAGLASRVSNVVGLTAELLKHSGNRLTIEGGVSITAQRAVSANKGKNLDFLGGRAATAFVHQFGPKASISQQVEFLPNFRESADLRVNTESTVLAPITRQIALRLSFIVRYDGQPVPGYGTTDRLFTSGIQISL
jgi:putative salt-induced outer membrane protein